jgi:hypothetical protein
MAPPDPIAETRSGPTAGPLVVFGAMMFTLVVLRFCGALD